MNALKSVARTQRVNKDCHRNDPHCLTPEICIIAKPEPVNEGHLLMLVQGWRNAGNAANVALMLVYRLRRWANIKATLVQCVVSSG